MGALNANDCCCSKCGVRLPEEHKGCCLCMCDTLCILIEDISGKVGTADKCICDSLVRKIHWVEGDCGWSGVVGCGELEIDILIQAKKCDVSGVPTGTGTAESDCYLCLSSFCLNLDGACPTSTGTATLSGAGTSTSSAGLNDDVQPCETFRPGRIEGDCGNYLKDGPQSSAGGAPLWDYSGAIASWVVDARGCDDFRDFENAECNEVRISAFCYPRINPAGSRSTRICKDCDCVCDCVVIEYEESEAFIYNKERVCASEQVRTGTNTTETENAPTWKHTFSEAGSTNQTISVTLVEGEDGCCYWDVDVSRGWITGGTTNTGTGTGTGTDVRHLVKTGCPGIGISLDLEFEDGTTGMLDITCAECDEYINYGGICCPCFLLEEPGTCLLASFTGAVEGTAPFGGASRLCSNIYGCYHLCVFLDDPNLTVHCFATYSEFTIACFIDENGTQRVYGFIDLTSGVCLVAEGEGPLGSVWPLEEICDEEDMYLRFCFDLEPEPGYDCCGYSNVCVEVYLPSSTASCT